MSIRKHIKYRSPAVTVTAHTSSHRFRLAALLLAMLLCLTGCLSNRPSAYRKYVDALLAANYKGDTKDYIKSTGANVDDVDATYLQNVSRLAENLITYYGLEISGNIDLAPEMTEVAKKIYSNVNYEVSDAYQDNTIYYVDVTVYPINILNQVNDQVVSYIDSFNTRVENGEFNDYVKEDYEAEFASGVIDILSSAADSITYAEPETVKVRIIQTDDNFYIGNEDLRSVDLLMIADVEATDETVDYINTDDDSYSDSSDGSSEN